MIGGILTKLIRLLSLSLLAVLVLSLGVAMPTHTVEPLNTLNDAKPLNYHLQVFSVPHQRFQ